MPNAEQYLLIKSNNYIILYVYFTKDKTVEWLKVCYVVS